MTKSPAFAPRLLSSRAESPDVRTFRFASPPGFAFVPGQFLLLHFEDDPRTWRAYSLCSPPARAAEWFELTVGTVGAFSARLGALRPGAESGLAARGPFGRWTYDGSPARAVLVSGGTGLAPFRAMIAHALDRGAAARLALRASARTPSRLLYRAEYDAWRRAGVDVRATITRPGELGLGERWDGETGRWTSERVLAAGGPGAVYYLCGPAGLVNGLGAGLRAAGVPAERVRSEAWGDYADQLT
ncbi:MAG: FAD-dependent oxidoreductase [Elusimicrobia bacterium]|nr:FAD-dependent oxidoreductase [Elusimicrobiota bacterium]